MTWGAGHLLTLGLLIFRVRGTGGAAREEGEPGAGVERVSRRPEWAAGPNAAGKSRKMSLRLTQADVATPRESSG